MRAHPRLDQIVNAVVIINSRFAGRAADEFRVVDFDDDRYLDVCGIFPDHQLDVGYSADIDAAKTHRGADVQAR